MLRKYRCKREIAADFHYNQLNAMSEPRPSHEPHLEPVTLQLPFRQTRNYIHSTDIYPALTALAQQRVSPDAYVASLVLRRPAHHQLRVCFEQPAEMVGTFSICYGTAKIHGWLVETDEAVTLRVPYDESRAEAEVMYEAAVTRFAAPVPGYTAFEQLILLMKVALTADGVHVWLSQINLRGPLLETQPVAVRLRQSMQQRFHSFELLQADTIIGTATAYCEREAAHTTNAKDAAIHG
jgi:hypothetical protein